MSSQDYKRWVNWDRYPSLWCGGCGIGIMVKYLAQALEELGYSKDEVVIVSGIGCTGRVAGYFHTDSVHGLHGRAVPLAEGIKRGNKKLKVIVVSGDGDLLGIGGNHLLHSLRRDIDITVICYNNEIYGMTGGQMSPTTPLDRFTVTSPFGCEYNPVNVHKLVSSNNHYFFARTSVWHVDHLKKVVKESLEWEGFSFVEVIAHCITNNGLRIGYKDAYEMMMTIKKMFSVKEKIESELDLGVDRK